MVRNKIDALGIQRGILQPAFGGTGAANQGTISGGNAPLTAFSDANVTITLGGSPSTALLKAASITLGWTGTLAASRLPDTITAGGPTGDATHVAQVTYDSKGRLTAVSSIAITYPGGITGLANPSASVGLTAVNGSATTAMRSDGAPPLSQSIVPTWTGSHTYASTVTVTYPDAAAWTSAGISSLAALGVGETAPAAGNVNISGGYLIGNTTVLGATTLGAGVVGSSLTSVGVLTTGVWNATAVAVTHGGTGAATLTTHGVVVGQGTSAVNVTAAGTAGQAFISGGASADPSFKAPSYTYAAGSGVTVANSNTGKMAGFGKNNNWTFTPALAGNVKITVGGDYTPSLVADEIMLIGKYGTPSSGAPALNDAATGTTFGAAHGFFSSSAVAGSPVTVVTVVTGLTPGTSYWFDVDVYVVSGLATITINNPAVLIEELYG